MFKINNHLLKIILFINIVIYIFLLLYVSSVSLFFDADILYYIILNVIIITVLFILRKEHNKFLKKQYLRICYIFIIAYLIVYFQIYLEYLLGNFDFSHKRFWISENIIIKSSIISSLGLFSFYFGYILKKDIKKNRNLNMRRTITSLSSYKILSFLLLLIYLFTINPLYLFGGYGKFDMGSTARYASILFELSIIAILVQNIINLNNNKIDFIKYFKSLGVYFYLLVIFYLTTVLISGDRGPIMYVSMGIISSYVILTKIKFPLWKILLVLSAASIVISSLVSIRTNTDNSKSSIEVIYESLINSESVHYGYSDLEDVNSFSKSTLELATSIRVFHIAVNQISMGEDLYLGKFQLMQIITVIPLGQKMLQHFMELEDYELTSAGYLTFVAGGIDGEFGSSCLSDIYLDFGSIGVIVFMILFGYIIRFLELSIYNNSSSNLIIIISFIILCQYAIYIPRSTIMFNFRNIIWVYMIMKIIHFFSSFKKESYANHKK